MIFCPTAAYKLAEISKPYKLNPKTVPNINLGNGEPRLLLSLLSLKLIFPSPSWSTNIKSPTCAPSWIIFELSIWVWFWYIPLVW